MLCFRCTNGPPHIQISEQEVSHSETPLEHLKIQYLTQARIVSTTDVITASDCTSNRPPVIDLALYLLANSLLGQTRAWTEDICTGELSDFKLDVFRLCII